MKRRLANVSPLKLGIVLGVLYGVLSLIFMVPIFLIISAIGVAGAKSGGTALPALFSGMFVIFLPVLYAAMGFIGGVISALIYNLVARWTGGIEFTTEAVR